MLTEIKSWLMYRKIAKLTDKFDREPENLIYLLRILLFFRKYDLNKINTVKLLTGRISSRYNNAEELLSNINNAGRLIENGDKLTSMSIESGRFTILYFDNWLKDFDNNEIQVGKFQEAFIDESIRFTRSLMRCLERGEYLYPYYRRVLTDLVSEIKTLPITLVGMI